MFCKYNVHNFNDQNGLSPLRLQFIICFNIDLSLLIIVYLNFLQSIPSQCWGAWASSAVTPPVVVSCLSGPPSSTPTAPCSSWWTSLQPGVKIIYDNENVYIHLNYQYICNSLLTAPFVFQKVYSKKNYQHLTLCFLLLLMVIIINIKFDEILTRYTVMYLLLINFSSGQLYKSKCPFADGIKGVVLDVKQPSPCWDPIITIVLHPIILLSSFLNIPIMLYFWIRTGFVSQKLKFSFIILYNL